MVVNGLKIYNVDVCIVMCICLCYRLYVMMYNLLYIYEGKIFM